MPISQEQNPHHNDWVDIGCIQDIPRRGARCVNTPTGKIGVFRTMDDKIFAIEDHCAHQGGPLTQGIVHGAFVTCPLHNWVFSLETGEAQGADEGRVGTIPLRIEHDRILMPAGGLQVAAE